MEKMTENQKQIVLQALCVGLPYGLLCDRLGVAKKLFSVSPYEVYCLELDNGEYMPSKYKLEDIKPYLRPMSSMTEEENKIVRSFFHYIDCSDLDEDIKYIDWLNENHFDYRGLITMGLALKAPEGMYK